MQQTMTSIPADYSDANHRAAAASLFYISPTPGDANPTTFGDMNPRAFDNQPGQPQGIAPTKIIQL